MGLLELFEAVDNSTVEDIIHQACEGVIDPELFASNLSPEDRIEIESGRISVPELRSLAEMMRDRSRKSSN